MHHFEVQKKVPPQEEINERSEIVFIKLFPCGGYNPLLN